MSGKEEGEEDIPEESELIRSRSVRDIINMNPNVLPPLPEFECFEHSALPHERILHLPEVISLDRSNAFDFFNLFFDEKELEILAQNTNRYALSKRTSD